MCLQVRALVEPTAEGDCFSSGVVSDGNPYGIRDGIVCSMPLRSNGDGNWEFVRSSIFYPLMVCCWLLMLSTCLQRALL